jgi:pimeloyl-ACP methyl ester carboxylesterase
MKNIFLFLSLLIICFSNTSCTVLQWRKSDDDIQQKFKALHIESELSYFKVDSLDLKVRIQTVKSNKENNNLVFIHGAPSSLSAWEGYLTDSTLRATLTMHAIDRPGYGYSNFGDELTAINTQAQIISAIIDEKKLENVIVIGSSYGGPLAARVGFLNKNIKAIVMISPAIDPSNEKDIWGSRFTQWKLTRWLVPTAYRVAGDEKKVHAKELEIIAKDWKSITLPVLHIHGDDDDIVPYENINFTQENFQNIKVVTIPNKGHEISWKHPEIIISHLLKLISEI